MTNSAEQFWQTWPNRGPWFDAERRDIAFQFAEAYAASARAEERQRCARIADIWAMGIPAQEVNTAKKIAAAIRQEKP